MATVVEDLLEDSYQEDLNGVALTRVFQVHDIDAAPDAVLIQAAAEIGINRGDPHRVKTGIQVLNIGGRVLGARQAQITVEYGVPDASEDVLDENGPGEVEFSVSVITEQTFTDVNGDPMIVTYAGFARDAGSPSLSALTVTNSFISNRTLASAEVDRPVVRATIRRRESRPPIDQILTYGGTINDSYWSGFAPQTWLCAGISSRRDGDGHMVFRDFLYRPETWRYRGTVLLGNFEPLDAREGNGFRHFDVYPRQDFNRLGVFVQ